MFDLSLDSNDEVWLGLGNEDFNTWTNNNSVTYQNWIFEDPDDFQCVTMILFEGVNRGKWRTAPCRSTEHYFCVIGNEQPSKSNFVYIIYNSLIGVFAIFLEVKS